MAPLLGSVAVLAFAHGVAGASGQASCIDTACDGDDEVTLLQVTQRNVLKQGANALGAGDHKQMPAPADSAPVVCPPPALEAMTNFSLEAFISSKWHVQQMMADEQESFGMFQCQSVEFSTLDGQGDASGWELRGLNHVDMPIGADNNGTKFVSIDMNDCLKAVDAPGGKFAKGNCSEASEASSPFWVLAHDEAQGYAVVSGGPPTEVYAGGCRTGTGNTSAGLFILTRQQVRDHVLVTSCRAQLQSMGFDISVLRDVSQTACPVTTAAAPVVPHVPSHGFGFEGQWHDDHGGLVTVTRTGSKLTMEDNELSDGAYVCDLTNDTHCEVVLHGAPIYAELQAGGHHIHWHMSAGHEEWQRVGFEAEDESWQQGPQINASDFAPVSIAGAGLVADEYAAYAPLIEAGFEAAAAAAAAAAVAAPEVAQSSEISEAPEDTEVPEAAETPEAAEAEISDVPEAAEAPEAVVAPEVSEAADA